MSAMSTVSGSIPHCHPLKTRRAIDMKTEPILGHIGTDLGDGSQLLNFRMAITQALFEE